MSKQVFISPIDEAFLTERDTLGDIRWEGNKCYKYVKLLHTTETIAGAIGDQLLYSDDTGHSTNTVVLDATDADDATPIGAGVCNCIVAGVADTVYYMWMQIKGPVVLSVAVTGSPSNGQSIMATAGDKAFGLSVAVTDASCGIIQDTVDKLCIIDCPF